MSIIRPCIRIATVAALRERTWAEERVFDSDQQPLAAALLGDSDASEYKPYMTVYTDDDTMTNIDGRQVYNGDRALALTIEIGTASAIRGKNGSATLSFAQTDEAMELAIDMV